MKQREECFFGFSLLFLFGLVSQKVQISQGPMGKPWIWIDDVAEYQPLRNCKQASTCQKKMISAAIMHNL